MRPPRFETWLDSLVTSDPQPTTSRTFAESRHTDPPYGIVMTLPTGSEVWLQCAATSPLDVYATAEQVVRGPALPRRDVPVLPVDGPVETPVVEAYLEALLVNAPGGEISAVDRYSQRAKVGAVPYGMTLSFYSGARIFLYFRYLVAQGRLPVPHKVFWRTELV